MAQEFELLIGPGGSSAFKTEAERREAWVAHRAELLKKDVEYPWAQVKYELGGFLPEEGGDIRRALIRLGLEKDDGRPPIPESELIQPEF